MTAGRLAQAGPPRELYLRPADKSTAAFLGDAIILPATVTPGWAKCAFGRVAVAADVAGGRAEIMLRPEQLKLAPLRPGGAIAELTARVVDVVFGGSMSLVVAAVSGAEGGAEMPVTLRVASNDVPAVGTRVRVTIAGAAHVFPPGSEDDGACASHL